MVIYLEHLHIIRTLYSKEIRYYAIAIELPIKMMVLTDKLI